MIVNRLLRKGLRDFPGSVENNRVKNRWTHFLWTEYALQVMSLMNPTGVLKRSFKKNPLDLA